jgi:hypothetical protein
MIALLSEKPVNQSEKDLPPPLEVTMQSGKELEFKSSAAMVGSVADAIRS